MSVHEQAERYKLTANDLEVWTPYWVNEPGVPEGPFSGKGSPRQIQEELDSILTDYTDELHNSEEARYLMLRNGLGVDCSGFAYHVLSALLKETADSDLAQELAVDKTSIEEAWLNKDSWQDKISRAEIEQLPAAVTLREVCDRLEKDPAQLTNVRRLCDERSSVYITRAALAQPADMIQMSTAYGDHIGIVTENNEGFIRFVSSDFDPVGPGGVAFHEIPVNDPDKAIEEQVDNQRLIAIRRLRVLT